MHHPYQEVRRTRPPANGRRIRGRALVVFGLMLGALALTAAGPAGAATVRAEAPSGLLVMYENPDFTGDAQVIHYSVCNGLVRQVVGQVASFDNRPLPGCQVALTSRRGTTTILCAGRGVVPAEFRQSPRLRLRPGFSRPCGITPTSG
jgi:hypothetical protein